MSGVPIPLAAWRGAGRTFRFGTHDVFYREEGAGDALLLVHGFPTASWDWARLWPALTARYRCIARGPARLRLLREAARPRATASRTRPTCRRRCSRRSASRDSGCSRTTTATPSRRSCSRAIPTATTSCRRACSTAGCSPRRIAAAFVQKLLAGPARPAGRPPARPRGVRAQHGPHLRPRHAADARGADGFWALLEHGDGRAVLPRLIRYMRERVERRARWVGALQTTPRAAATRRRRGRSDLGRAHGGALPRARAASPTSSSCPGIGHYPQVEAPDAVLAAVLAHFDR